MNDCEQYQAQFLAYVYDLLEADDVESLPLKERAPRDDAQRLRVNGRRHFGTRVDELECLARMVECGSHVRLENSCQRGMRASRKRSVVAGFCKRALGQRNGILLRTQP